MKGSGGQGTLWKSRGLRHCGAEGSGVSSRGISQPLDTLLRGDERTVRERSPERGVTEGRPWRSDQAALFVAERRRRHE